MADDKQKALRETIDLVWNVAMTVLAFTVLALVAVVALGHVGIRISVLPRVSATELAYMAGALWLLRGAR